MRRERGRGWGWGTARGSSHNVLRQVPSLLQAGVGVGGLAGSAQLSGNVGGGWWRRSGAQARSGTCIVVRCPFHSATARAPASAAAASACHSRCRCCCVPSGQGDRQVQGLRDCGVQHGAGRTRGHGQPGWLGEAGRWVVGGGAVRGVGRGPWGGAAGAWRTGLHDRRGSQRAWHLHDCVPRNCMRAWHGSPLCQACLRTARTACTAARAATWALGACAPAARRPAARVWRHGFRQG